MNQRRKENGKVVTESYQEQSNKTPKVSTNIPQSENSLWNTNLTAFDDLR